MPFLGEIPIDPRVAECGDAGEPMVHRYPDSPIAAAYGRLAESVIAQLDRVQGGEELPEVQM